MENQYTLQLLNNEEQRVLGALIEKSRTTPDYYPMTLSALTTACNQKTSRNPIVNYDEETVTLTLNALKIKGIISTATGGSSRATKYKHNLGIIYPLLPSELSVLALLLLRGPLTPGEINSNVSRLYEFDTIEEIQILLNKLSAEEPAYVQVLAKRPGQKEVRYKHLFNINTDDAELAEPEDTTPQNAAVLTASADLENRVSQLEQELIDIKEMLNLLMNQ